LGRSGRDWGIFTKFNILGGGREVVHIGVTHPGSVKKEGKPQNRRIHLHKNLKRRWEIKNEDKTTDEKQGRRKKGVDRNVEKLLKERRGPWPGKSWKGSFSPG